MPQNEPQPSQKTVGENFIDRFLKRNRLAVRSVKKCTMKIEAEIEDTAQKFHSRVFRLLGRKRITFVLNFVEVPLSISERIHKMKIIASLYDKDVCVSFDPNDKQRWNTGIFGVRFFLKPTLLLVRYFQSLRTNFPKVNPKLLPTWQKQHLA